MSKKLRVEEFELGMRVTLKCLTFVKGNDPFDYLSFMVVKTDGENAWITPDGIRIFVVDVSELTSLDRVHE